MSARRKTTLHENLWRGALCSPESGSRRIRATSSSRQAINGAMISPLLLVKEMAEAEMMRTPPGLMSGPAWRDGPSWIVSEALGKGPEVPSSSDTV